MRLFNFWRTRPESDVVEPETHPEPQTVEVRVPRPATPPREEPAKKKREPLVLPHVLDGSEPVFVVKVSPFIEHENVSNSQFEEWTGLDLNARFDVFEREKVLSFSEAELRAFLERSGLVMIERYGSGTANVEWVRIIRKPSLPWLMEWKCANTDAFLEHQFQVGRYAGKNWRGVAYVTTRFLSPTLRRKILFEVPHGSSRECAERGAFQIYVWSTPHHGIVRNSTPPVKLWGNPVDCRDPAFQPAEHTLGVNIWDGAYSVAELFPNALYIHHDLVETGSNNELKILSHLLNETIRLLNDPVGFNALVERAREEWEQTQRTIFTTLVEHSIPARSDRHREAVTAAQDKINAALASLAAAERELFGLQQSVLDPKSVAQRFEAEILKIQQGGVALVEKILFRNGEGEVPRLCVRTKEITSVNPKTNKTHLLGRYEIIFDLQNTEHIRFNNLDRRPDNCHGPHLNEHGAPCLGNIRRDLTGYLGHFEVEAAITLAIAFLQSPNPDDAWGRNILLFPLVEDGVVQGT